MSYSFVRITNYYKEYIDLFYRNHTDVHLGTYQEQHSQLADDLMESSSRYVKNLNKIGVKADEIITNAEPLQTAWRKEHHISPEITDKDLIILQIKHYQPDIVWIDDFSLVNKEWKSKLLKEVPSIKLFTGHHCAPFDNGLIEKLRLFDILFTCTPGLKNEFEKLGIETYLLYHAFDSSVLDVISDDDDCVKTSFVFTGSLITGEGFHKNRIDYIESILNSGINISIYGNLESKNKIIAKKLFYFLISTLRKLGLEKIIEFIPFLKKRSKFGNTPIKMYSKKLIKSSKPPVFGRKMFQLLSKSDICFNIHGDVAGNCAGNVRLFEATGLGTCLVTDWKENISKLFEPEKEMVTYKSKEECIEKVKWLLENPEERKKIAEAGQRRTLQEHTIEKRVEGLNKLFVEFLKK